MRYGGRRWRKLKGVGVLLLDNGDVRRAEVHWSEGHGIGKVRYKIKRFLNEGWRSGWETVRHRHSQSRL